MFNDYYFLVKIDSPCNLLKNLQLNVYQFKSVSIFIDQFFD